MAKSVNSISTILPELLKLYNNSMEGFDKITEAITSSQDTVPMDLLDNNNNTKRVYIPSFGYIKGELSRLDTNIKNLSNLGTSKTNIRLSDGSFRKIIVSNLTSEANDITQINTIDTFNTKNNFFFEDFLNPYLYVSFNLSGQIPNDTEKINVYKFILDLDTQTKINWFEENYKGKSDINYKDFLSNILSNGINYIPDEETMDMPPREIRYSGEFNVIRISDTVVEETVNGITVEKKRKLYKLNKLTYTDLESTFLDTVSLKVNDTLVVNSDPIDTRYKIISIDSSTNSVILELIEGYRNVEIGANALKYDSVQSADLEAQIGIGFNQYCVVFIKAIDPDSKIPAKNWSPGSAFYTNELTIQDTNGENITLESYYNNSVTDFSQFLVNMAKDKITPSTLGLIPDAPVLDSTSFKVIQINKQLTSSKTVEDLENLKKEKETILSEIKNLDKAISEKRQLIATKNYNGNNTEKTSDQNDLSSSITERNTKSDLYSSLVKQIDSVSTNESLTSKKPKYRATGFIPIPTAKYSFKTGYQQVIGFVYSYRYLSSDGEANSTEQLEYNDGDTSTRGTRSPWVEIRGKVKERVFNDTTNKFEWAVEDVENGDVNNINLIEIPISKGEIIELRVKSLSEAGYPANSLQSEWSDIIQIEFPDNLSDSDVVSDIVSENIIQLTQVKLEEDLSSKGVLTHIADSFTVNDKYYVHESKHIASGFLSPEQNPITLFDKLVQMTTKLTELEEVLKKAKGKLVVKMVDESGNEILIKRNQLNKFFAGYYADIVNSLDVKKGVIVSKTFFLTLENSAATTLELISRIPGSNDRKVKCSELESNPDITSAVYPFYNNNDSSIEGNPSYTSSDNIYNTDLKYDIVPMLLSNPTNIDSEISPKSPFQASQIKSQFIYCRYKDVASEEIFYSNLQPDSSGNASSIEITNADLAEYSYQRDAVINGNNSNDFVWGGGFFDLANQKLPYRDSDYNNSNLNVDETIEVHVNHPYLSNYDTFRNTYEQITGVPVNTPHRITDYSVLAKQIFRQSRFSKLTSNQSLGKKQNIYLYDASVSHTSNMSPASTIVYDRTLKTAFEENDQYLIGRNTCGSYLFLASNTHENITVDGKTRLSTMNIEYGSANSIRIPIIYQFRMTDYWGIDDQGLGNIAGIKDNTITNLTYAKRIGLDIYDSNDDIFSFDIEVFAKYKSDNLNLDQIPNRQIQVSIDDLRNTISNLSPSLVETKVDS